MKISIGTYTDASIGAALPAEQLTEVQAADGSCWAHVAIPEGQTVTAMIVRAEGATPEAIDVRLNPSWVGAVVKVADTAGLSARAGWPRLVLTLVAVPAPDPALPQ